MGRQLTLFLVAVQFLTRVPVPAFRTFAPDWIARSARYFPLVGALVGLASALVMIAASHVWAGLLPALLATAAGLLITGAFHEDGLADTADGLGGGQTVARRLEIMKDSRLGTYGVVTLVLGIALKVAALGLLPMSSVLPALVAAHAGGRAAAVVVMRSLPYVGDVASSRVKPVAHGMTGRELVTALLIAATAALPALLAYPAATAAAVAAGIVLAGVMVSLARRLIGGWVGDTLGAIEQLFEVGFLVVFAAGVTA